MMHPLSVWNHKPGIAKNSISKSVGYCKKIGRFNKFVMNPRNLFTKPGSADIL